MTHDEWLMLTRLIDELELEEGRVLKANGQWFVSGTKRVPAPYIGNDPKTKLGMWTEGTNKVVIEGQVKQTA